MKTIYVIVPYNNPEMLNQKDLDPYQSEDYYFKVTYANSNLKELNTASEVLEVTPLVVERIKEAEKNGAAAVIVFAFGDVGVKESKNLVSIPVMGLGRPAINFASVSCDSSYTVIPMQLAHNSFVESLVKEEGAQNKFILSKDAVNKRPLEMKNKAEALQSLTAAARKEIKQNNVDTITFACGSVMGMGRLLEEKLSEEFTGVKVVDPVEISFEIAKALIDKNTKSSLKDAAKQVQEETSTQSFLCNKK